MADEAPSTEAMEAVAGDVRVPATLRTNDGRHVADVRIPPFETAPDVLVWGERIFFRCPTNRAGEWREAFAHWVVP